MAQEKQRESMLLTDEVRELLELIGNTDITEVLIEREGSKLHVKRAGGAQQGVAYTLPPSQIQGLVPLMPQAMHTAQAMPHAPAALPQVHPSTHPPEQLMPAEIPTGHTITAPMVGTYYAAPSPKDPPFVKEGDEVHIGDAVGIVEAMKMMNEIESDVAGRVVRILVKNGQPVEYGQPLMVIERI